MRSGGRTGARFAKLDGQTVVPCSGPEWSEWFENVGDGSQVAFWQSEDKSIDVSTVFIGLNYGWWLSGKDIWFETMIFASAPATPPGVTAIELPAEVAALHGQCRRYSTWDEAVRGHAETISEVWRVLLASADTSTRAQKERS